MLLPLKRGLAGQCIRRFTYKAPCLVPIACTRWKSSKPQVQPHNENHSAYEKQHKETLNAEPLRKHQFEVSSSEILSQLSEQKHPVNNTTHQNTANQTNNDLNVTIPKSNEEAESQISSNVPAPTKEQLLEAANGFFNRLRVRVKWLWKRSDRPYNTDDYSAIFSWLVISNALLIILGTTTFFSLIILTFNTVFAQEFVARKFGEFITKNSKLSVIFENAIVPGWSDGKISFKKCLVSRRPKLSKKFIKGSPSNQVEEEEEMDDGNYTQFDLTIEEINITLSFNKWVNARGFIDTLEIKGVRGVVDRTHVVWDPDDSAANYKNVYQPGDFEIDDFKMEDALFSLLQPDGFRPFIVEVYKCELPRLRKHWLYYDFLNATIINGSYDGSLFTIHKRQRFDDYDLPGKADANFRYQRMRVDSLSIDHLNRGLEGPFGWITNGKVDMTADVKFPVEHNDGLLSYIESLKTSFAKTESAYTLPQEKPKIVMNLNIKLNNVKAVVPFQTAELSYVNYALIRPIVGYINSKNTYIEIDNTIIKNVEDFSGSWTIYDCLLMDDISVEVYDNFVNYVADEEARLVRMKKVAFWSVQLFLQLVLLGIGALS